MEHGDLSVLAEELRNTEQAFAATVKNKDLEAFSSFIAEGAIFHSNPPLRGRSAIVEGWSSFFEPDARPLQWVPCAVEVEPQGKIGLSTGPYWVERTDDSESTGFLKGVFSSVWQREEDGSWKIILDAGTPPSPVASLGELCPAGG